MSDALRQLLSDPFTYIVLTGIGGLAALAIRSYVKNAVDHRFALRLESHRHGLELTADAARFELQRRLAASSSYLQKQHAAAAEVYAAVRVAHGAVSNLYGLRRVPDLTGCNEEDVREILISSEVLRGRQEDLIAAWREDRRKGEEEIVRHLVEVDLPRAEAKQQHARNLMYVNEIYFSDAVIQAFDEFVAVTNQWILRRRTPPVRGEPRVELPRATLDAALDGVQTALRAELRGDDKVHLVEQKG